MISAITIAQHDLHNNKNQKGREKIKQLYIAYITQEINLNEAEAEKFWPVHNQYEIELKMTYKKDISELGKEEEILSIRKKFATKFNKIIGNERTDVFFKKDREFREKLINRLRDHQMDKNKKGHTTRP
jgi:hypothetical protein